jgi:hypothetical protein
MNSMCKYKHIFGIEGQGFHSYRVMNIAIFDVIGTILIAWIISIIFKIHFGYVIIVAFLLGVILHRIFCVNTTINKYIFGVV